MNTKFYEFNQNNTGGSFVTNDKLCHRIIIEATSNEEANSIAESLGCYWNGVEDGYDCPCCGNRWYTGDEIDLDKINNKYGGWEICEWSSGSSNINEELEIFKQKYIQYDFLVKPFIDYQYGSYCIRGKVKFENIEQYAQLLANQFGWTTPDVRIFYLNGGIKEIFMESNNEY